MLIQENSLNKVIYIPEGSMKDPDAPALFAAKELRTYLGRMTGFVFEIKEAVSTVSEGILLLLLLPAAGEAAEKLGNDGFHVTVTKELVTITGGKRGLIYGAYDFLEKLGCRFFTSECEKIPVLKTPEIPEMDYEEIPVIEYRFHNYFDVCQNPKFAVKRRFNGFFQSSKGDSVLTGIPKKMGGSMSYAWFVHSFAKMIPVEEFGETHPEYFALVNGERVTLSGARNQLCLTNPEVLRICTERVRACLLAHPEASIISISQNDWGGNCECESCRKIDAEEGSPSGTLLRFVNAIAEALEPEFPHVIFDTLAYQYTRQAPKITRNRHNVCVRLCSIECCFAHSFEDCDDETRSMTRPDGTRVRFIDDLRDWGNQCSRMYIWDYTTCFAHYPTPHPNWRVLQSNIQAMVKNHVKGVFEQANGAKRGGTDFNELRLYLISKLLWDPYCDIEQHKKEFMSYFYGEAAPYLSEYLTLLCDTAEKKHCHVGFNDEPVHAFLSEEMLDQYEALFKKAKEAVQGDPLRLYRVAKAELSIRYVRLRRKAVLQGGCDSEELERFFSDWRGFGLTRIEEWYNLDNTHRSFLEKKWNSRSYFEHWTDEEAEFY